VKNEEAVQGPGGQSLPVGSTGGALVGVSPLPQKLKGFENLLN